MTSDDGIDRRRGAFLPHCTRDGAIYFVTFRLADSIPKEIADQYHAEQERLLAKANESDGEKREDYVGQASEMTTGRFDALLDEGYGKKWLARPEAASVITDSLQHFHGERYWLWAFCVMPTHVHVVVQPLDRQPLESILHSWKSFTANKVNTLLGRTGAVWQQEYFDHLVRNAESLDYFIRYTIENPIKAGLKDWRWVGVNRRET